MPVYKDECVYSFDSVESPQGIDVCLHCNLAFSPAKEFTALHTALTGHDGFLNIRKIPKERAAKQIKLAIDAQTDKDLWETVTQITPGSLEPGEAESRAKTVLEADSYNKEQEIVAWELEVNPCEHTLTLEQTPSASGSSKCSQCDLDSNLWLCLGCGTLSCGRPQFGGGGGNGHALAHYDATKHPLAVKLGSITPDGHADVFCYACDDEVKDPEIKAHLATFGIDLASQSKTEKSMAELQLEQNAKFDFSMHDQDGHDLVPVSGPGLTGMRNMGNTCYFNSVLQCLLAIPEFSTHFPENTTANVIESQDPPNDLFLQLSKLQAALSSGEYAKADPHSESGYQRGVVPAMLKHLVGKGHPEFATMRQQDAYEFLSHLLSKITQSAKSKKVADPVADVFGFETNRRIECENCHSVKYKVEPEESMSIQVPIERDAEGNLRAIDFKELMHVETQPEQVELNCTVCASKQSMTTTSGFKTFPKVFVLNVRRFELVNWVPQKVDVPVSVPLDIDLEEFRTKQGANEKQMPEEEEVKFEPNAAVLEQLVAMGFPESKCSDALEATGNQDPEAAMNWLLQPEEQQVVPKKKSSADPEQIVTLQSMGFTPVQAEAALKVNNNNVEAAVEWLFSGNGENPEQYLVEEQPKSLGDEHPTGYELRGIVCHKGGSVHAGHYVAFIRRESKWYLFNDEKVVEGADVEEMQKFAYLYIFQRRGE